AYGMLPATDRAIAHGLAGRFLAGRHDVEPGVVANHFERAGELTEAAAWFQTAARTAFDAGDLAGALSLVERGLACDPTAIVKGELRVIEGSALGMRSDWAGAGKAARDAMTLLPRASTAWFRAAATAVFADVNEGRLEGTVEVFQALVHLDTEPEPTGPH